ncbi:MAG TPA: MMPL family transporter [Chthoniobacteraceae bacterium]|nr:MMPL family transporter [Chthoniobacteraceae bacterium]
MSFDRKIAYFVTHRRGTIYAMLGLLVVACATLVFFYHPLDSEVLNLLPGSFDSVQGLKTYNKDFSQNRELTFAIYDDTGQHQEAVDDFTKYFASMLRKEMTGTNAWVQRVMERSPVEGVQDETNAADIPALAVPLLMNMQPADFDAAIAKLQPDAIRDRVHKLKGEMEAGSLVAEVQLNLDPLGVTFPALKPLFGSGAADEGDSLVSPDGSLHMVFVITNQTGLAVGDCRKMMATVKDFEKRVYAGWKSDSSHTFTPRILLTGRTPYVAEMSKGMEQDVISTLAGSVALVAGVFFIGFRRVRPLLAIMHVLLLCCIVAVTAGFLIFHELNGITIGFCSILVGLGVDFGMLLYGTYQAQRHLGKDHEEAVAGAVRQLGRGIIYGALTTAAGFVALVLSDCAGFSQLGVLIAIGILLAAFFMMTVFFVFMGPKHVPREHDWLFDVLRKYVALVFRSPKAIFLATGAFLVLLNVVAYSPKGELKFVADLRTLEPKNSQAGFALQTISKKMGRTDPVIVFVDTRSPEQLADTWTRLRDHWQESVGHGIDRFNTPPMLSVSPQVQEENVGKLKSVDFAAARDALTKAIDAEGLQPGPFKKSFTFLDQLDTVAKGNKDLLDWRKLPENSIWWFLLDKFFGTDPNVTLAYVWPEAPVNSVKAREALQQALETPGPDKQPLPIHISGWSYTQANLIPWSRGTPEHWYLDGKLAQLSIAMVLFNVVLLIFLYRRFFPLFVLMLSLFLSVGGMIASLKLFHIPLNLFNVLAFPLVLGVGVDYGIYMLLAVRQPGDRELAFATILKPVLLSGLTAVCGFGSLGFAKNPSLMWLGLVCALGVGWCLFSTVFFILPAYVWKGGK